MELTTLNLSEALELATQAHGNGYLDEAEDLYGLILQSEPQHPFALQCLGLLLHQRGYGAQAVSLLQASIALVPTGSGHFSLGNILLQQRRMAEAVTAFEDALALEPENAEYWNVLGETLQCLERPEDATIAFLNALVADPQRNKSKALLGIAYSALGRIEEAADVYRRWLEEEPENSTAAHLQAACTGEAIPERASNRYIETTFDEFAPSFDEQLLVHLSYQAPILIEAALANALVPERRLQGLDAGCGTGLCGTAIRPYVSHLTGVDLSSKMLALAGQREIYDALKKTELTHYLFGEVEAFDLIVMADTLIYFGALEKVMTATYQSLRDGGVFIFTVETADRVTSGFNLNLHGRYSHDRDYVCATLAACGFAISSVHLNTLRTELGRSVEGLVVTALKSASLRGRDR